MVCKKCGMYTEEDVAVCEECGEKQDQPEGKIPVLFANGKIVYVNPPIFIPGGNSNIEQKQVSKPDNKYKIALASFLLSAICFAVYFGISPQFYEVNSASQYHISGDDFISANWSSGDYMLGGEMYHIGDPYKKLKEKKWKYDKETYAFIDEYTLDGGEKYHAYITLTHPEYQNINVKVGFTNKKDMPQRIEDCSISSILVDNIKEENNMQFMLPGGIQKGSSLEEIYQAYGEAENTQTTQNEDGIYTLLEYNEGALHLDLVLIEGKGLQKFGLYQD